MNDSEKTEKLCFQYIMNYKAYRRYMLVTRIAGTLVVAGGLAALCAVHIILGILLSAMSLFIGAIVIIVSLSHEQTYMIFDTRFVIKNRDKRASVPLSDIVRVEYKRAFYEKDLATGTVYITAKTSKGKTKKYKMRHVFNAKDGVEFLRAAANKGVHNDETDVLGK